jgi:hypothetical protein
MSDEHEKQKLQQELVSVLKLQFFSKNDLVSLLARGLKITAQYQHLTEAEKKQTVNSAVHEVIKTSPLSEEEKESLHVIVDLMSEPVLDTLVDFGKDTALFVKSKLTQLFACLCPDRAVPEPRIPLAVSNELFKIMEEQLQPPFTESKVILILSQAVKFMAKYKNYVGLAKKSLVVATLKSVIMSLSNSTDEEKTDMLRMADLVAAQYIDAAVELGKDKETFRK